MANQANHQTSEAALQDFQMVQSAYISSHDNLQQLDAQLDDEKSDLLHLVKTPQQAAFVSHVEQLSTDDLQHYFQSVAATANNEHTLIAKKILDIKTLEDQYQSADEQFKALDAKQLGLHNELLASQEKAEVGMQAEESTDYYIYEPDSSSYMALEPIEPQAFHHQEPIELHLNQPAEVSHLLLFDPDDASKTGAMSSQDFLVNPDENDNSFIPPVDPLDGAGF
ncbi:MAG: hypothetical protein DHS20C10_07820 [marine bacterium B5-7]|nr:MAG: hypothetical protein DHS20C10_07820 [marine bacterium B5-7]